MALSTIQSDLGSNLKHLKDDKSQVVIGRSVDAYALKPQTLLKSINQKKREYYSGILVGILRFTSSQSKYIIRTMIKENWSEQKAIDAIKNMADNDIYPTTGRILGYRKDIPFFTWHERNAYCNKNGIDTASFDAYKIHGISNISKASGEEIPFWASRYDCPFQKWEHYAKNLQKNPPKETPEYAPPPKDFFEKINRSLESGFHAELNCKICKCLLAPDIDGNLCNRCKALTVEKEVIDHAKK